MLGMPRPQAPPVPVARWRGGEWRADGDQVAAEEPLQLLLDGRPLSIVMRTPGNDLELALGRGPPPGALVPVQLRVWRLRRHDGRVARARLPDACRRPACGRGFAAAVRGSATRTAANLRS